MFIVMIFINFGNTFTTSGLGQALIQNKEISYIQECTIFYINLAIGFIMSIVLFLLSKPISVYFQENIINDILKVICIYFIINSFSIIQESYLSRNLNFKTKFYINIISQLISSLITIYLGFSGYGIWALVSHILTNMLFRTIGLWVFSSWRPSFIFDWDKTRLLIDFGINILIANLTTVLRISIIPIIIGKSFSLSHLGFYKKANSLQNITSKVFTTSIQNVLFPVLSRFQDDIDTLGRGLSKSLQYLFLLLTPIMIFFIVNSDDIIILLLTEKWIISSSYLKLLSIMGILYPLQMMNLNALKSVGQSTRFMLTSFLWDISTILTAIILSYYGSIINMIYGQIFVTFVCLLINVYCNGKYYGYRLYSQIKDLYPLILINITFYLILTNLKIELDILYLTLFINIIIALIVYCTIILLFRKKILFDIIYLLRNYLGKNGNKDI